MTKLEKLIKKFKSNPESLRLAEIELIIKHNGYIKDERAWSHTKYKKENKPEITISKHNNDCKNYQKKQAKKHLYPNT